MRLEGIHDGSEAVREQHVVVVEFDKHVAGCGIACLRLHGSDPGGFARPQDAYPRVVDRGTPVRCRPV